MRKIKIKNFSQEALGIYDKFKVQVGSDSIAKPVSIQVMFDFCRQNNPSRILEMGGGIGTLSYALLKHSQAAVDIYEPDDFCLQKLKENLATFEGRYRLIEDYRILPPQREYDLVVVDGGNPSKERPRGEKYGYFEAVWFFLLYLKSVKHVYVEGHRHLQRLLARKALRVNYLYKSISYDDIIIGGEQLNGGLMIVCRPSSSRLLKFLNFLFWEIVGWTTIKNFFYYKLKRIKKLFINKKR